MVITISRCCLRFRELFAAYTAKPLRRLVDSIANRTKKFFLHAGNLTGLLNGEILSTREAFISLQLAQEFDDSLVTLFRRGCEVHLRPSAEVAAESGVI